MKIELTPQQTLDKTAFSAFAQAVIAPVADAYDREERTPPEIVAALAQAGYLGALVPRAHGGAEMDAITFGLLNEAIGWACSSVRSLITVHSMVSHAITRWGSKQQRADLLPRLARGELLGAFGLSEPNVGSDAKSVETTASLSGDEYVVRGTKKWTTYGQIADLFLIFANCDGKLTAFLVERGTPGFSTTPILGMHGTRASMLAELHFDHCRIPKANRLGGLGFGLAAVATDALGVGRYSVAWGCVGLAQACLDASIAYTSSRKQFGSLLKEHQLIQQMVTNMITEVQAARLLCYQAGYLTDCGAPSAVMETWIAKYFASTAAARIANDAVQIHGAYGCSSAASVQRYLRDSKVMEIIEGSTQIQQMTIARSGYETAAASRGDQA